MEVGIAAVLMKTSRLQNITSPYELANQSIARDITYGLIPGSQTYHYFRLSNNSAIQKMWHKMRISHPSAFVWSSLDGVNRVRNSSGKFVFFVESSFAQYLTSRAPCDLTYLSEMLNPSQYAFAFKKGNPLKKRIDKVINSLKANGVLERLQNKWWKRKCRATKKSGHVNKVNTSIHSMDRSVISTSMTTVTITTKSININKYYDGYNNCSNYLHPPVLCILWIIFVIFVTIQ